MKLLKAIIRPEREIDVVCALERAGIYAMTKVDVLGRGQQKGVQVGDVVYDELAKLMLMVVVEDQDKDRAVRAIRKGAYTGRFGDGKVYVLPVDEVYTIRTGDSKR